jgi:hypothetical protein
MNKPMTPDEEYEFYTRPENQEPQGALYILEGFLARLAESPAREKFVLNGGVLLASFDNRRPTRDVDGAAARHRQRESHDSGRDPIRRG